MSTSTLPRGSWGVDIFSQFELKWYANAAALEQFDGVFCRKGRLRLHLVLPHCRRLSSNLENFRLKQARIRSWIMKLHLLLISPELHSHFKLV